MGKKRLTSIDDTLPKEDEKKISSPQTEKTKQQEVKKPTQKTHEDKGKKRGKKYQKSLALFDPKKPYSLNEALQILKKISYVKFDPAVEVHLDLNIDPEKAEHKIRFTVNLPHGSGKKVRILAFTTPDKVEETKKAGATHIGSPEILEKINEGWLDFDKVVTHPSMMAQLAQVSKKLGPKGLMPNPKSGTIGENTAELVKSFLSGQIEIKNQADSSAIHTIIGKLSFSEKNLEENFITLYKKLISSKPGKVKEPFIKTCVLKTTMSPGIRIDLTTDFKK